MKEKNMKKTVLLVAVVLLAGCKTRPITPSFSLQSFPEVGATATVGIGEQMLTQGYAMTVDAIIVAETVKVGEITVEPGKYPLVSENAEFKQFQNVNIIKGGRQRKNGKLYVFKNDGSAGNICLGRNLCAAASYTMGSVTTYSRSRNQQTLIYSGKIGNRITLGYREFVNEIARPAFSNDVGYDLSESTTLGYKGARVQVISATNTEITYKILAEFSGT
jgi:hypothetical protein